MKQPRFRFDVNTVGSGSTLHPLRPFGWVIELRIGRAFAGQTYTDRLGRKVAGRSLYVAWHAGSRKYRRQMGGSVSRSPLEVGITDRAASVPWCAHDGYTGLRTQPARPPTTSPLPPLHILRRERATDLGVDREFYCGARGINHAYVRDIPTWHPHVEQTCAECLKAARDERAALYTRREAQS